MPTPFRAYAEVCAALRDTPGRLAKVELAARFLAGLDPDERAAGARFLAAKPLPETSERGLDVGGATLRAALGARQRALLDEGPTVASVAEELRAMSAERGREARGRRERRLRALLGRCSPEERAWLLALLRGELRTGAGDGVVLEAIARASGAEPALVRRAHLLRGDLGEVAALALAGGPRALAGVRLKLFHPLRPMLAGVAPDLRAGLAELGACAAVEPKYDGARIALHKRGGEVRVFSRRLTDVTASVPECAELGRALRCDEAVVEGEAVAYDARGRPLPFQEVMRRFRRVHGVAEERARIPLTTHLFDCLHVDGRTLLDEPAGVRWEQLARIAPADALTPRTRTGDPAEAQRVLDAALAAGHEGVMLKDPRGAYAPGKRGASWLKVKLAASLDCAIIGAEWGSGKRAGKLSNYHLAVRVPDEDGALLVEPGGTPRGPVTLRPGWAMVGKTFKGLTDMELDAMTGRLRGLAERDEGWGFRVRPGVVVEVAYNEIQRSPQYVSGFALRFARVTAVRDDKGPEEADTLGALRRLFQAQAKGERPG